MVKKAANKAEDKANQELEDSQLNVKVNSQNKKEKNKGKHGSDKATDIKTDKQASGQDIKMKPNKKSKEVDRNDDLENKIAAAEESAREWQDKYVRLSAEFDNYRKRTLREKMELTKNANGELLKDILSVVDDFERGRNTIEKSGDIEGLKQGLELIYTKFIEFLRQNGVKEIDAKEKEFDIDFHEALTKIPAPTDELKGKVVDVIEKGYLLNDKVIRYTKVVVGE
jgi:molecular chaperone GrpE